VSEHVAATALEHTALSPRELACRITDREGHFLSESSVYRILKAYDLVASPARASPAERSGTAERWLRALRLDSTWRNAASPVWMEMATGCRAGPSVVSGRSAAAGQWTTVGAFGKSDKSDAVVGAYEAG